MKTVSCCLLREPFCSLRPLVPVEKRQKAPALSLHAEEQIGNTGTAAPQGPERLPRRTDYGRARSLASPEARRALGSGVSRPGPTHEGAWVLDATEPHELVKTGSLWLPRALAPQVQGKQRKLTKTCLGQPFSSGSCVVRHAKGPSAQMMESRSTDRLPDTATIPWKGEHQRESVVTGITRLTLPPCGG